MNFNFNNVLKKIDSIESNAPKQQIKESKEVKASVQLQEGFDTSALRMLAGTQPNKIVECGMPAMGAPMPSMTPASLNMSAGNASEIVQMVRGLMDLAKTDAPTQTGMPAMGAPMPSGLGLPGMGHSEPMFAEPEVGGLGGATLPDVKGMDAPAGLDRDGDGDHDMGDHAAELGGTDATDLGGAGDDEIMDLIKKIRTGEPVKVTTAHPVKVTTDQDVKKADDEGYDNRDSYERDFDSSQTGFGRQDREDDESEDDESEDEGFRGYDNSPKEKVKAYDPNSMADVRDKVSGADKEYTPPGSGDNPLPKTDKEDEKKKEENFESQLFAEYKKFVNEGKKDKKADKDYDGDGEVESPKDEVWGSRAKAAAKSGKPFKEAEEKTMSKAAKGVMKYGKDGMKALAKAGKEGKSLEPVKAKYNKYD